MYDIAIIGGGPAGLTAAIYARRANKKTLLLESTMCGGQMINTVKIDNYPALAHTNGLEIARSMQKQAEDLGAEIEFERATKILAIDGGFRITTEDDEYQARSIIIATGTNPRKLGIADEARYEAKGVSYCATCDGAFYKDQPVAVYGGGNSAFHEALYLAGSCSKVYLVHRSETFRADAALVERAKNTANIEIITNHTVKALSGEPKLEQIILDDDTKLDSKALFVAIGRIPNGADLLEELAADKDGFIVADDACTTNIPGIFVAGDVRTKKLRQIVTATADGAEAATAAIEFLNR